MNKKPNIILIVIDSLRRNSLDFYSGRKDVSPNMDRIAEDGVVFDDAFCCWNTTDPSLTSILTGKYPLSHGITDHGDRVTDKNYDTFNRTRTRTAAVGVQYPMYG